MMKQISVAEFRRQFKPGTKFASLPPHRDVTVEEIDQMITDQGYKPDGYGREIVRMTPHEYGATVVNHIPARATDIKHGESNKVSYCQFKGTRAYQSTVHDNVFYLDLGPGWNAIIAYFKPTANSEATKQPNKDGK